MLPRLAALNPVDCAFTHTKPATYGQARLSSAERVLDDAYFFFCELGRPVIRTSRVGISDSVRPMAMAARDSVGMLLRPVGVAAQDDAPSLTVHIGDVVSIRSKEEMRRVAARRVVAMMADEEAARDGAITERPRNSGGDVSAPIPRESTVANTEARTLPRPTLMLGALANTSPEGHMNLGAWFCSLSKPSLTGCSGLVGQEEVRWVDARLVVAAETNARAFVQGAVLNQPGNPVGLSVLIHETESAITAGELASKPRPADVRAAASVNLGPETLDLFYGKLQVSHSTLRRSVVRGRRGVRAPSGPVYFSTSPQPCEVHA